MACRDLERGDALHEGDIGVEEGPCMEGLREAVVHSQGSLCTVWSSSTGAGCLGQLVLGGTIYHRQVSLEQAVPASISINDMQEHKGGLGM